VSYAAYIAILLAASTAAADPVEPRLLTAPTAWLPGANGVLASVGIDQRADPSLAGDFGVGGIGELELGVDSDARECATPPCGTSTGQKPATPLHLARAAFRIGAPQDAWFDGQPAVALGVRETIGAGHAIGEAYLVASRELGPFRLHAGLDALESSIAATHLFPLGGFEYTPPQFSKTTLMADLAWQPVFNEMTTSYEWIGGIGVRYRTFSWLSVELDYRAREGESLAGSTLLARVIARWPPKRCAHRCAEP
jgi:hypothetical protein